MYVEQEISAFDIGTAVSNIGIEAQFVLKSDYLRSGLSIDTLSMFNQVFCLRDVCIPANYFPTERCLGEGGSGVALEQQSLEHRSSDNPCSCSSEATSFCSKVSITLCPSHI